MTGLTPLAGQIISRTTQTVQPPLTRFWQFPRSPLNWLIPLLALASLAIWQFILPIDGATALLLPRPSAILGRFMDVLADGTLMSAIAVTSSESAIGFVMGVGVAFLIGYAVAHNRTLECVASPYIVAFQSLPIVALAPALILWFGPGLFSNSVICAFIIFFPMLINTVIGLKSIAPDQRLLMESFAATRWHTFRRLELPAALPILLGGFQVSLTLAVAGAVVAEAVTPLGGIGSLLYAARSRYDSPLAFVSILVLTALSLASYGVLSLLKGRLLRWQQPL